MQELINILSHIENKDKPVYIYNAWGEKIESEVTDIGNLEDRFGLYID